MAPSHPVRYQTYYTPYKYFAYNKLLGRFHDKPVGVLKTNMIKLFFLVIITLPFSCFATDANPDAALFATAAARSNSELRASLLQLTGPRGTVTVKAGFASVDCASGKSFANSTDLLAKFVALCGLMIQPKPQHFTARVSDAHGTSQATMHRADYSIDADPQGLLKITNFIESLLVKMATDRFIAQISLSSFRTDILYWTEGHGRLDLTPTSASVSLEPMFRFLPWTIGHREFLAEYFAMYGLRINPQCASFKARVIDGDGISAFSAKRSDFDDENDIGDRLFLDYDYLRTHEKEKIGPRETTNDQNALIPTNDQNAYILLLARSNTAAAVVGRWEVKKDDIYELLTLWKQKQWPTGGAFRYELKNSSSGEEGNFRKGPKAISTGEWFINDDGLIQIRILHDDIAGSQQDQSEFYLKLNGQYSAACDSFGAYTHGGSFSHAQ